MTRNPIHPIERISVVDTITARLRTRILSNELREGQQLKQEGIAEAYSVSRMAVREALRQLEAEGLVDFHAHRGALVSRLEPEEVEELFDLRALIETELMSRAATRATPADHASVEAALLASEAAYDRRDVGHWGELNWEFHRAMYRPAGRERSLAIAQTLNWNTDRYVRIQLSLTHSAIDRARYEHRELYDTFRSRDGSRAAELLKAHLVNARDALTTALRCPDRQLNGLEAFASRPT